MSQKDAKVAKPFYQCAPRKINRRVSLDIVEELRFLAKYQFIPNKIKVMDAGIARRPCYQSGHSKRLTRLEDHPALGEVSGTQVICSDPKVKHSGITPHPIRVFIRVNLKKQSPFRCA